MSQPLEGVRVLDLSMYLPGPFCTQILADFGAEVIKVEPMGGEWGRQIYPAFFYAVNRGKKSIVINLKTGQGKDIFVDLAKHADVIVEQFRPGVMERLGLDYGSLYPINPRLIYCSISGYGQSGPLKYTAGHDINYLSLAGVTSLTGSRNQPGMSGVQIADVAGGSLQAVNAILLALIAREKTGRGQYCDVAMLDGAISLVAYSLAEWSGQGKLPECNGGLLTGGYACYQIYATADNKFVSLGAVEAKFWQQFCERIGRPEYIPYQWDNSRQDEILADIQSIMAGKTRQEWVDYFANDDICFTPVLDLQEMTQHPQVKERNMVMVVENIPGSGKDMVVTGCPVKLSNTPAIAKPVFPKLGEHTDAILQEIGYSPQEIADLKKQGILA
ncbi:MAG: CoA transferase [Syntrophomonadaceae bacterium]|nr:CoA transferase [Syntrophomonadaceae bacterium]